MLSKWQDGTTPRITVRTDDGGIPARYAAGDMPLPCAGHWA